MCGTRFDKVISGINCYWLMVDLVENEKQFTNYNKGRLLIRSGKFPKFGEGGRE